MGLKQVMQHQNRNAKRGLMRRLWQSQDGNVAVMSAAVILPVALMVGSGVDFSRYYVVKSRMQLACDAGALAGRKVMGKESFTADALNEANKFFDGNFISGSYGSRNLVRSYSENGGIVQGSASAKLDNSILRLANIDDFEIEVKCNSKLDIANTDIMFVLDTTGSMDETDGGGGATRMAGLRVAVTDFAKAMESAKSPQTVIRYGFVPYAQNVQVGHLLRPEWIANTNTIQSRVAIPNGTQRVIGSNDSGWVLISGTANQVSYQTGETSCTPVSANRNNSPTTSNTVDNGNDSKTTTTVETYTFNGQETVCEAYKNWQGNTRYNRTVNNYVNATFRRTSTSTVRPNFTWRYRAETYDLTNLKGNSGGFASPGANQNFPVGDMTDQYPSQRAVSWRGCVEEMPTQQITNFTNPPDLADIDIDHVPNANDDTRWRMQVPGLAYMRGSFAYWLPSHNIGYTSGTSLTNMSENARTSDIDFSNVETAQLHQCVNPARALEPMTVSQVNGYVTSLIARGSTYHDVGMVWGGRLISNQGIYAASNQAAATAGITRHVIFMSDGATSPSHYAMTPYGLEPLDKRRTPWFSRTNTSVPTTQVNGRLQLICDQMKNQNITVWAIGFGQDVVANTTSGLAARQALENCASPGRYFVASNNAALRSKFVEIASQIAELRLTQ